MRGARLVQVAALTLPVLGLASSSRADTYSWRGTDAVVSLAIAQQRDGEESVEPRAPAVTGLDLLLHEVYGLSALGRLGAYPDGTNGLAFATTSCNNGSVDVPWHGPMAEDHPFVGAAMFRRINGRLEMIGTSWIKHAFYALASDQCGLGCHGSGGGYLNVGCSDTYAVSNNGSQYFLGPREEVNPCTGVWHCLGSWFDGTPVDCVRSNDGSGLDGVAHRLVVHDDDLTLAGAQYYYEGVYYAADDVDLVNNFMWREVVPHWSGSAWVFADVGGGFVGTQGPLVLSWGDVQVTKQVSTDDGFAILAAQVTDAGGGTWHYEYALYNQSCDRAIQKLSIPVGDAAVSNVGFRDIDRDASNDWTFATSGGLATWSTGGFGTQIPQNPVRYQTLYNFWFDASAAPVDGTARLSLYKPGAGDYCFVDTRAPYAGVTAVVDPGAASALALFPVEPNPFARSTNVSFALVSAGRVRLSVVDVAGRLVKTLVSDRAPSGRTTIGWNGRDDAGSEVASGIYFFRLESAKEVRTTKGILLK